MTPSPSSPYAASAARSTPPNFSRCPAPPPNAVEILSTVGNGQELVNLQTVHLLTVSGVAVTDCLLFDRQPIRIWDAARGIALLSTNDGTLWTLDLRTSSLRNVGYSSGDLVAPLLNPEATQAVLRTGEPNVGYWLKIVDLETGATRTILRIGPDEYLRAGLVPLRWLGSGILLTPGSFECGFGDGILKLDPNTGALTRVADGAVGVLSPSGTRHAYSAYAQLGDGPYLGQCGWHNTVFTSAVGGQPTLVQRQANRDFYARDTRDDGEVLYVSDDSPGSSASPASDMGLYLFADGVSTKQFGEARVGYWQSVVFVGPDSAIAAEALSSGQYGSVEVILVSLCRASTCQASAKPIHNPTGPYPTVSLLAVRP